MSPKTTGMSDELYSYFLSVGVREDSHALDLRRQTQAMDGPATMQIAPEQGQMMGFLARLIGARRALEIGTFTGYSALCVAQAMGPQGRLIACDVSREWTDIGREAWRKAGVADRIDLRLAPAAETMQSLIDEGHGGGFDMAFIDADKENYPKYYELSLKLVRTGGLIIVDNVLWGGSAADPTDNRESTKAIRTFNEVVHKDERVDVSLVPVGDGMTLLSPR